LLRVWHPDKNPENPEVARGLNCLNLCKTWSFGSPGCSLVLEIAASLRLPWFFRCSKPKEATLSWVEWNGHGDLYIYIYI
jgi:hypothetical protein